MSEASAGAKAESNGAEEGIRTPTLLRAPAPQAFDNGGHTSADVDGADGSCAHVNASVRPLRLYSHKFAHAAGVLTFEPCRSAYVAVEHMDGNCLLNAANR